MKKRKASNLGYLYPYSYPQSNTWESILSLDILFIIGLPRSGTSLVHKLVHEYANRKAPTFRDFGIDVSRVARRVAELNPTFKDETSLAEDSDFRGGGLREYRRWLETRGDKWVLKSPDHIGHMFDLLDVFPEAKFLWCMRPAAETIPSIVEYWQVAGVGPPYRIEKAVKEATKIALVHPDIFHCIYTPAIPEWESDREPRETQETERIDQLLHAVKGTVRNVASRDFKELYS